MGIGSVMRRTTPHHWLVMLNKPIRRLGKFWDGQLSVLVSDTACQRISPTGWKHRCLLLALSLAVAAFSSQTAMAGACREVPDIISSCEKLDQELPREKEYNYQMAVCLPPKRVLICTNNQAHASYDLVVAADKLSLDFHWAVPPSSRGEFAYISTSYTEEQPLSVYRNGFLPQNLISDLVEGIFPIFKSFNESFCDDNESCRDDSDITPHEAFREYHRNKKNAKPPYRETLTKWHALTVGQRDTYDFVRGALGSYPHPPVAAERLIKIRSSRPKTSWVPFNSRIRHGHTLSMVLSYSGENDQNVVTRPFYYKISAPVPSREEMPSQ